MSDDRNMQSAYEHALILSTPPPSSVPKHALLDSLITRSEYASILKSHSSCFHYTPKHPEEKLRVEFPETTTELEKLIVGIAALQAFVQTNWTGPEVECDPADLLCTSESEASSKSEGKEARRTTFNAQAVEALAIAGEPAYHLAKKAGFLWLAKTIFNLPSLQELPSLPVWKLRLGLVNLRLLDTPVPLPGSIVNNVQAYIDALPSSSFSTSSSMVSDLQTSLTLLLGLYHSQFIHLSPSATKFSSETFLSAVKIAGLEYELTGRMGKKTKFQVDEKSQLVVLARSRERDDGWKARERMSLYPEGGEEGKSVQEGGGIEAMSIRIPESSSSANGKEEQPRSLLLNDDTLLERTQFTSSLSTSNGIDENGASTSSRPSLSSLDPSFQPVLHPLDESILLALSLSITNTSPSHGLTTLQIQSFVSRVLEDGSQNWSIHSMALLLRSRLEANRSRTVERGLLQIQSLVDQLKLASISRSSERGEGEKGEFDHLELEKGATPLERLKYFYNLDLPSTWELERELATRYLGLGVVRSAMEIFERLEMWEDVARCYSALGEEGKAIKVVKDLLEGKLLESETTMAYKRQDGEPAQAELPAKSKRQLSPVQQAKLWCLLGDLERLPEHYETAWEVSSFTSSRAMRSLGQVFFQTGDYEKGQSCLEKALAINPLFGKVWFILGCAAMRNEDWKVAEQAFRRCTALDEEDGESWNNLATVVLHQTTSTSASAIGDIPASTAAATAEEDGNDYTPSERVTTEDNYDRKRTAFTCLGQAIKHSYDSWRIWTNYLLVSVDVGELMETCRAMTRLCELRADKDGERAVDLDVLERLVNVVVKDTVDSKSGGRSAMMMNGQPSEAFLQQQRGLPGRVRSLFETCLLPRITDSSRIYGSYARLLFALGDLSASLQASLKAYRVDVVLNDSVSTSRPEFEKAAQRVSDTVDMLRNLGDKEVQSNDGEGEKKKQEVVMKDWKLQARSMVRTFLGRTKESFGEEESWLLLQEELKELKSSAA